MSGQTQRTDVVVVGGGLAGSLAALEAARAGVHVAVVVKGSPRAGAGGNTAVAGGGFAAAFGHADPEDSPWEHLRDTLRGGEFLNDQRLARLMVEGSLERIHYLEALGVHFEHKGDRYCQQAAPGHSRPRSIMVAGGDMRELIRVLADRLKENGVAVHHGLTLAEILIADGRTLGAACLDDKGRCVDLRARAVVLATGGLGRLYPLTSNPPFATGDGFACGYRAGARLRDMEFVQFAPAGLAHPEALRGFSIGHDLLALPGLRVLNARGDLLSTLGSAAFGLGARLELTRLFHQEVQAGRGGPHGGVYLDLRAIPVERGMCTAPALWKSLLVQGVDPSRDLLEIAPEAHSFCGGFDVDENGETSRPGLYAIGDVAGGYEGANRLPHNGFPKVIVSASRAGEAAGRYAREMGRQLAALAPEPPKRCCWPAAPDLRERLRDMMLASGGPIRSAEGLAGGLATVEDLQAEFNDRPISDREDLLAGLATRNLLQVAQLVLTSALHRKESRGSHFRADFPRRDDKRWLANLVVERGLDGPILQERPVNLLYMWPEETGSS